ncbi:MAG: rRNA cytosine-C5-methyltransferase [Muribaculaceae bacterium]|nr:rRNA cytosine-C5-methyltransferase [Muribaculaceae bacterium]
MNSEFVDMLVEMGEPFSRLPETLANTEPEVSVRVNRAKGMTVADDADIVPWCADGYYLPDRPRFTFDPALHQGLYYVQDASSMAQAAAVARAVEVLGPMSSPLRYLDACAAPGGKTTAAMTALPAGSFVVANEFDPRRCSILVENLAKWGMPAVVTRGDASALRGLDGFFDIIAADVPCSGEGMMRKDQQAVAQWSAGLVAECAVRQRDIVDCLWQALRPGGIFIYSTCTFNPDEDERVVARLIDSHGAEPVEIPALSLPGIVGALPGFAFPTYRFLPGEIRGEGLFLAMVRKPGDSPASLPKGKGKGKTASTSKGVPAGNWLDGEWSYGCGTDGIVTALPRGHEMLAEAVERSCKVVSRGITVGEVKGRDLVPAQQLAMAVALRRGEFPEADVDRDVALAYLRREAVVLPSETPRGFVLLTHNGHPLGFVKNLGNRANNLYPAPWRILSNKA